MQKAQQNRMAQFERKKQRGEFDDVPLDAPPVPTNFEVDYRVMDVTQMTFPNASFDCVIDKATLDTMCQLDEESDSEEEENEVSTKSATYTQKNKTKSTHVSKMLRESCRVLRPGGVYVCVTRVGVGFTGAPSFTKKQSEVPLVRVPEERRRGWKKGFDANRPNRDCRHDLPGRDTSGEQHRGDSRVQRPVSWVIAGF